MGNILTKTQKIGGIWLIMVVLASTIGQSFVPKAGQSPRVVFKKTLTFQKYRFEVITTATGAVRDLVLQVFNNQQSLITIRQKADGTIINAEVADLDRNGSPEVYLYSCTYGSGSFGKVYGFQFFPNSFDAIRSEPLTNAQADGYMGHDIFKIENGLLGRKFPIYRPGDANAQPTGGTRTILYELQDVQGKLLLTTKK
ncbi:MAG: hypothetical protein EAZ32_19630 [Cytophagia bacterium]|nr:MAG: hypothetical protein EAZ46_09775 [Runella sp.]TAG23928.1 MAG: hypothetical protein EAZ38_02260 [Cytophagales bacterium]TAG34500.1 MAG: hypothetical protein EAZ32_19630 [Cytophagia bacterium]TAG55657.1 MAG: hypothetical protein EAZ29_03620 [Runella slithyformis]TAG76671.1 MAG: hypothetical protein EAZ22_17475 [Cytophagales bacterium]